MNTQILISLSAKHHQFIQEQVQSGRYPSGNEMIALALELLEESIYLEDSNNRRNYEKWVEETKKKIAIGIEASERGEVFDGEEVIKELLEEISLEKQVK